MCFQESLRGSGFKKKSPVSDTWHVGYKGPRLVAAAHIDGYGTADVFSIKNLFKIFELIVFILAAEDIGKTCDTTLSAPDHPRRRSHTNQRRAAIDAVCPWAVDLSTGIERAGSGDEGQEVCLCCSR